MNFDDADEPPTDFDERTTLSTKVHPEVADRVHAIKVATGARTVGEIVNAILVDYFDLGEAYARDAAQDGVDRVELEGGAEA